eukprot:2212163-Rhodomonas_salina.1
MMHLIEKEHSPLMATLSERLGIVDEKDEFSGQAGSEIDWCCWREPDFVFDLALPLQRTNQTRRLPAKDFPMSSLVIQSEVPDASEDVVPHCDPPKANKALNLSCVKGSDLCSYSENYPQNYPENYPENYPDNYPENYSDPKNYPAGEDYPENYPED